MIAYPFRQNSEDPGHRSIRLLISVLLLSLALLGRPDDALREAYDRNWVTDWRYFFYVDPNLDSIRDTPQFQEIFSLIRENMAEQLEHTHAMQANGEILPVPLDSI